MISHGSNKITLVKVNKTFYLYITTPDLLKINIISIKISNCVNEPIHVMTLRKEAGVVFLHPNDVSLV